MRETLTEEIAEQFLADQDSVDLNNFTSITEVAAESLSNYQDYLCLNGLCTKGSLLPDLRAAPFKGRHSYPRPLYDGPPQDGTSNTIKTRTPRPAS